MLVLEGWRDRGVGRRPPRSVCSAGTVCSHGLTPPTPILHLTVPLEPHSPPVKQPPWFPAPWDPRWRGRGAGKSSTPFEEAERRPSCSSSSSASTQPCSHPLALGNLPWTCRPAALHTAPSPTGLAAHPLAESFTPLGVIPFLILWGARQAPLSMVFFRQEYWSG